MYKLQVREEIVVSDHENDSHSIKPNQFLTDALANRDLNIHETPFRQASTPRDTHKSPAHPCHTGQAVDDVWSKIRQQHAANIKYQLQHNLPWLKTNKDSPSPTGIKRSRSLPRSCSPPLLTNKDSNSQQESPQYYCRPGRPCQSLGLSGQKQPSHRRTSYSLQVADYQPTDMISLESHAIKRHCGIACTEDVQLSADLADDDLPNLESYPERSPSPDCLLQLRSPKYPDYLLNGSISDRPTADTTEAHKAVEPQPNWESPHEQLTPVGCSTTAGQNQLLHYGLRQKYYMQSDWNTILQQMQQEIQQSMLSSCAESTTDSYDSTASSSCSNNCTNEKDVNYMTAGESLPLVPVFETEFDDWWDLETAMPAENM